MVLEGRSAASSPTVGPTFSAVTSDNLKPASTNGNDNNNINNRGDGDGSSSSNSDSDSEDDPRGTKLFLIESPV